MTRFFMFLFSPCDALLEYQKQRALRPKCRLSFVHALEVVRDAIAEFQMTARHLLVELLQRLWRDLARYLLPKRRNRINPHVVKRKMSKFHLRRLEHARSLQPTIPFCEAVVLI